MDGTRTLFSRLDFTHPGLVDARARLEAGDEAGALRAVVDHFRTRSEPVYLFDEHDIAAFDDPEVVVKSLRSFRYRKHELLVFQILDRDEVNFPFTKPAIFSDIENGAEMVIQPQVIRESYKKRFNELLALYRYRLLGSHIDYEMMQTDTPYDKALFAYLHKRMKLI